MIYPAPLQDVWMYHSSSQQLHPTSSTTHRTFFSFHLTCSTTNLTTHIYLSTWLSKWEYTWTKSQLRFFSKKLFHNRIECPFEVSKGYSFTYYESLELIKVTCMSSIFLFVSKYSSWGNYLYREFSFKHGSNLHGRCMWSKEVSISNILIFINIV